MVAPRLIKYSSAIAAVEIAASIIGTRFLKAIDVNQGQYLENEGS